MEATFAIAIFAIAAIGIFHFSMNIISHDARMETRNRALAYAQEGIEAMRSIRDINFMLLTNGDYGLERDNNIWVRIQAPENIDDFYYRTIVVSDVLRDENGNISDEGMVDPYTKKIVSRVEWDWGGVIPQSVSLETYLSNWSGINFKRITCQELNKGDFIETVMVPLMGPPDNNCGVRLEVDDEEDPPEMMNVDTGAVTMDVAVDGNYAYLAGDRVAQGLRIVDMTDRGNPILLGEFDIGARGRKIIKEGNYAYVGRQAQEGLAIVNVSNPSNPSVEGTVNIGGNGNGMAIKDNYLYIGAQTATNSLKVVDISDKANPTVVDSMDFGGIVSTVEIRSNNAFVGLKNDIDSFHVLDISNPASPVHLAVIDVGEQVNDIDLRGAYAFVATELTVGSPPPGVFAWGLTNFSLKVVDISNPAVPVLKAYVDVGGEIKGLVSRGDYLYTAIDSQSAGYIMVNISNPLSPFMVEAYNIGTNANGIDADLDYIYVSTTRRDRGMIIIEQTAPFFETDGEYIHPVIDTQDNEIIYNYITWDHQEAMGGTIKFQFRTGATGGAISDANWVGPDGTTETYYEVPGTIITTEPGAGLRYFQFKAFFETDGAGTPVLNSITVNCR